jgi:NAD(P)-dependent dehydrogenase (short-subunit alcohol dehydrogenase family)
VSGRSLSGRGAVVTGAGRGIGAAVASALPGAGARVVLAARTERQLEETASKLRSIGEVWAIPCDVTEEESVRRLGRLARDCVGTVQILVNSAGGAASARLARITLSEWNRLMTLNTTSVFLATREFVPDMVATRWGRVVNMASIAGLEGARYIAHYSASKHAVVGFTRSVALELEGTGVTVNAVCPGYVDTPMTERTLAEIQAKTGRSREESLAAILATVGQTRLIRTEEVAEEVLRLCSDEARDENGEAVVMRAGGGA